MEKDAFFYYSEGRNFYLMAQNCLGKTQRKFNNELLFNILSMSMERMLIAIIMHNNKMPVSETVSGLLRESKEFVAWSEECIAQARWLNRFVHLCSLEPIPLKIPNNDELQAIHQLAMQIKAKVDGVFAGMAVS